MTEAPAALIGVDWGSSNVRAYLMTGGGTILDAIASADGVATVAPGAFAATFRRLVGGWLDQWPALPVLASGMVGSRNGWREAPYVPCPADARAIAADLLAVEAAGRRVLIVPGLSCESEDGQPDVMRGEEVEILGIATQGARLVVLPGSHCKWVAVDEEEIARFQTFVTGELFAALRDHTLIGAFARTAPMGAPGEAFARGVLRGASAAQGADGSGLIGALFGARSLPLTGKLAEADAGDYLSGLLIGAEIVEARRRFPRENPQVAGASALAQRYLAAFAVLGERASAAPPGAAARGLLVVARQAGLL
ncbi:2-keto-3-deoxygalactonate kinase [Roseiarcus fermentans]|uniref:2-keto-3-deoxygalactonate kinase n=1 Tax=Roseiarcus fermentans TaxID=1473586 RepID=A0A366FMI6_9HYPH|nr:2-dehydro-3-deoxygalactonokinase [Roseiarcus fermentans]RBP15923.1 2-keto-3-deoxygalactonate kinase [Roseiarcus fermentans]